MVGFHHPLTKVIIWSHNQLSFNFLHNFYQYLVNWPSLFQLLLILRQLILKPIVVILISFNHNYQQ